MAAPDPVSIGSISSTEAPSVMSASACCCIVDTLPPALVILKSLDDSPAASKAFVRFGASYWTYRVDVVVSGSSTPTLPLPCAATLCKVFITAKSAVNLVTSTDGTAPPPDDGVLDELDELDPQLAAAAASARAAVTAATCFGRWCMQIPLLSGRADPTRRWRWQASQAPEICKRMGFVHHTARFRSQFVVRNVPFVFDVSTAERRLPLTHVASAAEGGIPRNPSLLGRRGGSV